MKKSWTEIELAWRPDISMAESGCVQYRYLFNCLILSESQYIQLLFCLVYKGIFNFY